MTQSQLAILRAAACALAMKSIDRPEERHELVQHDIKHILAEEM